MCRDLCSEFKKRKRCDMDMNCALVFVCSNCLNVAHVLVAWARSHQIPDNVLIQVLNFKIYT